jgi:CBS-domain-containing membrane protein
MTPVLHAIETVREVMTGDPVTVRPDTTVAELDTLMRWKGVASCPVVDNQRELVGIASRVDLLRALRPSRELGVKDPAEVGQLQVRDIMRAGVVTVEPDDPLVAALDLIVDTRLHALPVVQRGPGRPVVIGVVTQRDLLSHFMRRTMGVEE